MNKFVLLITILFWIFTGCSSSGNPDPEQQIYIQIVIQPEIVSSDLNQVWRNQIWRIETESFEPELVAQLNSGIEDKPVTEVFSVQELTDFEELFSFLEENTSSPASKIYPVRIQENITPSPDNQYLAWIEGSSWSPPDSTIIFGMDRLVLLNLQSGERRVLQEVGRHSDGEWSMGHYSIGNIVWSPDSQFIAFVEGWYSAYQAKLVNIQTGEIKDLGEARKAGNYLNWSPDGSILVTDTPNTLNILSPSTKKTVQEDLGGTWGSIRGVDWSSDGKRIVFSASRESIYERLAVYIVDIETRNLIKLPLDDSLSYENPQWSPNNKFIALNVRPKWGYKIDRLFVYDVEAQSIVANLEGERREENQYYWSTDSQFILVTRGDPPNTEISVEFFYWKENRTEVVPLPKEIGDNYYVAKAIGFE